MERFCIDESGYTGFDLLNEEQQFQGASAICISEEEARDVISRYFPNLQAEELKYRALARRTKNLDRLLELQRHLLKNYKCVTYVASKRFLLTLMFLDYAVEPFYYARGVNFYQDGNNYALASLLFYTGNTLFGPGYEKTLAAFQKAVKQKTPAAIEELLQAVAGLPWEELPEAMGPLYNRCPDCISAILTEGVSTDAAIIVLQSLITRMEVMAAGPYRVDHDRSKNLNQYHELLQRFINHKESIEFRQSDIATLRFPLKLTSVIQVDSKDCLGVQLADILIGGAIDAANAVIGRKERSNYTEGVISSYAHEQFIHMLPSIDFEEQKKFRAGTQADAVIDYFGKHFSKG